LCPCKGSKVYSFQEGKIKMVKHVGFKGAEKQVQKEGYSAKSAAKIIGASKAHASPAAKKANPRLNKTGRGK
jgi:hypothetical protein